MDFQEIDKLNEAKSNIALVLTEYTFDNSNEMSCLMKCYIKSLFTLNKVKKFIAANRYYAKIIVPMPEDKAEVFMDKITTILKADANFMSYFTVSMEYNKNDYFSGPWLAPKPMSVYINISAMNGRDRWRLQVSDLNTQKSII